MTFKKKKKKGNNLKKRKAHEKKKRKEKLTLKNILNHFIFRRGLKRGRFLGVKKDSGRLSGIWQPKTTSTLSFYTRIKLSSTTTQRSSTGTQTPHSRRVSARIEPELVNSLAHESKSFDGVVRRSVRAETARQARRPQRQGVEPGVEPSHRLCWCSARFRLM